MLSIVIPAWNEEKYLPKLLNCIKKQTFKDYEVIVADADSTDNTARIAKKFGCRVVKGGNPAIGRNSGAKAAKGDILLFLDADVQFENDFLKTSLDEIKERKLDAAGVHLRPLGHRLVDNVFLGIYNISVSVVQFFYASTYGGGIYCRRWLHGKINGFDKTILLGEDLDYVNRASKHGKFRILRKPRLYFSMRRFENEGRLKVGIRHFLSASYRILFGQIRSNIFNYNLRYRK